jgi:hypothetical protein
VFFCKLADIGGDGILGPASGKILDFELRFMDNDRLNLFVIQLHSINWFSHGGEPSEHLRVFESLQSGWDWGGSHVPDLWETQSRALEARAQEILGDGAIDQVFSTVSHAIHEPVYVGLCSLLDRMYAGKSDHESLVQRSADEGIYPEVMDAVKRDICWAGVEYVMQYDGFFTQTLERYRNGRWPFSWEGIFPHGQAVVI